MDRAGTRNGGGVTVICRSDWQIECFNSKYYVAAVCHPPNPVYADGEILDYSKLHTCIGKLKLCVWTAQKQSENMLATNRTCLSSRHLFRVGKLVSHVWKIDNHVLLIVDQSKHGLYSCDLFARHFTKWRTKFKKRFTIVRLSGTFHMLGDS